MNKIMTIDNKNIIINIGRQIGSGGSAIAQKLADEFGFKFYDRELLNLAAKESGFSEKYFEQNDEHRGLLKSWFHIHAPYVTDSNFYSNRFSQEGLFQFQSEAIRKAAEAAPCVFVGRCADYILRDHKNMVSIFITADIENRVSRVMERNKCSRDEAMKTITNGEEKRATYYNYYTGKKWGCSASYDLCINSSALGIDETEKYIASFIRQKYGMR